MVVLATMHNFWKRSDNIDRHKFERPACRKEVQAMAMEVLWAIHGTACAVAYDKIHVGGRMGPRKGSIRVSYLCGCLWYPASGE